MTKPLRQSCGKLVRLGRDAWLSKCFTEDISSGAATWRALPASSRARRDRCSVRPGAVAFDLCYQPDQLASLALWPRAVERVRPDDAMRGAARQSNRRLA